MPRRWHGRQRRRAGERPARERLHVQPVRGQPGGRPRLTRGPGRPRLSQDTGARRDHVAVGAGPQAVSEAASGPRPAPLPSAGSRAWGARSDEGWGSALRPLPPEPAPAPLAAGWRSRVFWEHLETGCLETLRVAMRGPPGRPGRPASGCGMRAPPRRPARPPGSPEPWVLLKELTPGPADSCQPQSPFRVLPQARGASVRGPGLVCLAARKAACFPAPGAGMFPDGGSRCLRRIAAVATFLAGARPALRAASTPGCQPRGLGRRGRFPRQPHFLLFLIFLFMVSPTLELSRQFTGFRRKRPSFSQPPAGAPHPTPEPPPPTEYMPDGPAFRG